MEQNSVFDVIIVGGSYAGLSAAMALGRSLKKVLVIDSGEPCNKPAPHSHNFLTQDGKTPSEISSIAQQQVSQYKTVHFHTDIAIDGKKTAEGFEISTQSGKKFEAKKLIFATGVKDNIPNIPGFSECWGKTVIHCPYCHGYEFHGKKTGIWAPSEKAFHLAGLVNNLTQDLTMITSNKSDFTTEQVEKLQQHNIKIEEGEIHQIEHENGNMVHIVFKNGKKVQLDTLYAGIPFEQHCKIPETLGCEITEQGYLKIDGLQKTTVDGVYACGDNTSPMRSVANAVQQGNFAGAAINKELTEESF
ncbi:NAD(P)/FAD-dependent oxidoreductase [Flagellimonas sp.]|uniref:NAD(P)/FAD-dependent oxidoreductase n=1 Tax=Flagellimonas sp. TaxID=2058762 RepID=UPI003BAC19F1